MQNLSKCSIYKGKRYNSPLTKLVSNTFRRGFSMTGKCDTKVDFTGDFASFDKAPVQARFELLIQFDQLWCPQFAICAGDDLKV